MARTFLPGMGKVADKKGALMVQAPSTTITDKFDQLQRIDQWYAKGWITEQMRNIYKIKILFPAIGNILEEIYLEEIRLQEEFGY